MESKDQSVEEGGMPICPLCARRRLGRVSVKADASTTSYFLACLNCGAHFSVGRRVDDTGQVYLRQWIRDDDRVLASL